MFLYVVLLLAPTQSGVKSFRTETVVGAAISVVVVATWAGLARLLRERNEEQFIYLNLLTSSFS